LYGIHEYFFCKGLRKDKKIYIAPITAELGKFTFMNLHELPVKNILSEAVSLMPQKRQINQ
jgi:hypothetical protein